MCENSVGTLFVLGWTLNKDDHSRNGIQHRVRVVCQYRHITVVFCNIRNRWQSQLVWGWYGWWGIRLTQKEATVSWLLLACMYAALILAPWSRRAVTIWNLRFGIDSLLTCLQHWLLLHASGEQRQLADDLPLQPASALCSHHPCLATPSPGFETSAKLLVKILPEETTWKQVMICFQMGQELLNFLSKKFQVKLPAGRWESA